MSQPIDYVALYHRYQKLGLGSQAELRRVAEPEDLVMRPAFYRLLPGQRADSRYQRIAFCLPWVRHQNEGPSLGAAFARPKPGSHVAAVYERRLFQVVRAEWPGNIVQLRRLMQQVEPVVDWKRLGPQLFYWGRDNRCQILEDYYVHHSVQTPAFDPPTR